ncbi:hypothetical protein F5Y01DRAFT_287419 [Xylaria sp. FL0043]|nr:hypothetical protein F5Y01DRAFT_287419 [Xylaria sp. FL0043]
MSGSDIQSPVTRDDVWTENAALIRELYISERKTETKLRDKLGLRKKLKKSDWPTVYQHVQGRGGKETGIYVNGVRIPWKKAWKEIRRSGYRSTTDNQLCELPAGVVVRTPSPTIYPNTTSIIHYEGTTSPGESQ